MLTMQSSYVDQIDVLGDAEREIRDYDLDKFDYGAGFIADFIEKHPHDNYSCTIFNAIDRDYRRIICDAKDIPELAAEIYRKADRAHLEVLIADEGEQAYAVLMRFEPCTPAPGTYRYHNHRLEPISREDFMRRCYEMQGRCDNH